MSDIVPVSSDQPLPAPAAVSLGADAPSIEELFLFAREAELRVRSLRMTILERTWNAKGEDVVRHDVQVRHAQQARITTYHNETPLSSDYDVWIGDGDRVRTYSARGKRASDRARRPAVVGPAESDLPAYSAARLPLTALPAGSIADAFLHPHGLFRNVLVTGPLAIVGTMDVNGREAIVVRSEHPRATEVLTDRPDRRVEVGIDRGTGFLLHLSEHVGDSVTHLAEVLSLEVDPDIPDSTFELHLGPDVRMIY
jgi:hypothetical protein